MKQTMILFLILAVSVWPTKVIAAPSAPTLSYTLSALDVTINWTTVPEATGYMLYYAPAPYAGSESIVSAEMGTQTSFSATLWEGAAYLVAVKAYDGQDYSGYSNVASFVIEALPPPAVPTLSYTTEGTSLDISWEPIPEATGYLLSYALSTYTGPNDFYSKDLGEQTGFSYDKLVEGQTYTIAVQAYNSRGNSNYSNIETFTADVLNPPGVSNISYTLDGTSIVISWDPIPAATGYLLNYTASPYTGPGDFKRVDLAGQTSFSYSNLSAGATYTIALQAYNDLGESGYSNIETFTVSDPTDGGGQYFPDSVGDTWYFNLTEVENNVETINTLSQFSVAGTRTILGKLASVFVEKVYGDFPGGVPAENYYAKEADGVLSLGNNDPEDTFSPEVVPYYELTFPIQVGQITQISKSNLDYGSDLDEDGINEKYNLTLQSEITGFESVNVPAGSFPNSGKRLSRLDVTLKLSSVDLSLPLSVTEEVWAAPGVGIVKRTNTMMIEDLGYGAEVLTSTEMARGYQVGGVRRGMGWPTKIAADLSPGDGSVPVPIGRPVTASNGSSFLVMARKATGTPANYFTQWVGMLADQDGAVMKTFAATPPAEVNNSTNGERAAIAFDGGNYLLVYEQDISFPSQSPLPSLRGVLISPAGSPVGSNVELAPAGSYSPDLVFDGTNYLLVYRNVGEMSGLEQIYGAFISPETGQVTGSGAFPISSAPGYQAEPAVAFDGTNFLVLWDQDLWTDQGRGVYATRVSRTGTVLDPGGIQISSSMGVPAVAFDGTNYLVVFQRALDNLNFKLYGMRISKAGQLLDGLPEAGGFPLTTGINGTAVSASLAFTGTEYLAAWVSSPAIGVYDGLFGARIGRDGTIKSPGSSGFRMSAPDNSFYPDIVRSPSGGLLVWLNQKASWQPNEIGALSLYPMGP